MPTELLIQGLLHETPEVLSQEESVKSTDTLTPDLLRKINAYWRAANYVSVGQIYLYDNPLLKEPLSSRGCRAPGGLPLGQTPGPELHLCALEPGHQKVRPGYVLYCRPGPRRAGYCGERLSRGHVERSLSERRDRMKLVFKLLFKQFSFPGAYGAMSRPTTPGSIHEGGELGYSLSHAFGAAFDDPVLIVAWVIGDGEAETGSLDHRVAVGTSSRHRSPTEPCCRSCT